MKRTIQILAISFFSLMIAFAPQKGFSQNLACPPNIDWEFGDSTGWSAEYGGPNTAAGANPGVPPYPGGVPQTAVTTPNVGFVTGRHTVMNVAGGTDPYGGFPVVAPNGGQYSIKVGDDDDGAGAERVQFKFTVPTNVNNYSVRFLYAIVLNDPGHTPDQQPKFTVTVRDSATGLPFKDGCSDLVFIAASDVPGFFETTSGTGTVRYKPWTSHVLNLSGSAGKTVLIDVVSGDCSAGAHFGYGYFDVEACEEYNVTVLGDSCNLDRGGVSLHGPTGFMTYEWYNSDFTKLLDTGEHVTIQPVSYTPEVFRLVATPFPSVSLCKDTLVTLPYANININKIDSTCIEPNNPVVLDANIFGGSGDLTYQWWESGSPGTLSCNNCKVPTAIPTITNRYTVRVDDTIGCHRTETMVIGVNENTVNATEDFVLCRPGYTQLNAEPTGSAPLTPVDCDTSGLPACTTPEMLLLGTQYRNNLESREDTTSINNPFAAQYSSAHMQFMLRKEDLYAAGMRHGAITSLGFEVKDPGTTDLSTFTISLACSDQSSLGGAFVANPKRVYTATAPLTPVTGWNDFVFDKPYNWDRDQNLVVDICFHNPVKDIPASIIAINTGASDALVAFTVSNTGNVCLNGKSDGTSVHSGRPLMRVNFCKSADADFAYTWVPGTFLQDSTIKSPVAYVNKTVEYHVNTIGGSDCPIKDSVTITVPIHEYDYTPRDTSICFGAEFGLVALGNFTSVEWFEFDPLTNTFATPTSLVCSGCSDPNKIANPIARPKDTTTYAAVFKDQYGCTDTFYSYAVVRPLPPVNILNKDTTIKYGQSIQLLVGGAFMYSWSPLSTLTHPNVAYPYATPTEPTTYYVWGLAEDGCRNIDSVKIDIDYRDNLFVPTAFSPNGDGKNDVFRVSNITFQKLQEFRVFNRWGQEIYSTTDPIRGWDGSWKGVPQDMGVYQYLIKVAYPDGYIETYKGDVSLVR